MNQILTNMRRLPLLLLLLTNCCSPGQEDVIKTNTVVKKNSKAAPVFVVSKFEGSYTGSFARGFITITLNYVVGKNVSGYNITRGTRINMNGVLKPNGKNFSFLLREAGDPATNGIFQFTIDTTSFLLIGTWNPKDTLQVISKPMFLKKQPRKTEENFDNELGTWIPEKAVNSDTTLDFSTDGICEFRFYQFPGDSASQILSVTGSYIRNKDSVMIDWQKNSWTPSQRMKLVILHKKNLKSDYDDERLSGFGWNYARVEGD